MGRNRYVCTNFFTYVLVIVFLGFSLVQNLELLLFQLTHFTEQMCYNSGSPV